MKQSVGTTLIMSLWITSVAFADSTFTGQAKYTKDWCPTGHTCDRPSFSNLEELGVQKAAETNAVQNCLSAGLSKCYPSSSRTVECNGSEFSGGMLLITCSASATAVGLP